MKIPKYIATVSVWMLASAGAEEGFLPIFNGKDLTGWEVLQGTADYRVDEGTIIGTTAAGSPNSFLCSKKHYFDFDLRFDVKLENDELNSGCQVRSNSSQDYKEGVVHGYQVEIEPKGTAGFIYDEGRRGWLSKERVDKVKNVAFKSGQWNSYRVLCVGDSIKTWVNGVPVADVVDSMTRSGFIGLQVHGVQGDPNWQVRWKNIRIREIPLRVEKFPTAEGLTGFKTKGNWKRQPNGVLRLEPRAGEVDWTRWNCYLWFGEQLEDFVCSYEFKYDKGGNSGFYLRVGDPDNPVETGIEIQINDVFGWEKPLGHHEIGGVLATRGPASNMAKPAGEWNRMTVSCQGSHLKVWLNDGLVQNMFLDKTAMSKRPAKGWVGIQDHGLPFELRKIRLTKLNRKNVAEKKNP